MGYHQWIDWDCYLLNLRQSAGAQILADHCDQERLVRQKLVILTPAKSHPLFIYVFILKEKESWKSTWREKSLYIVGKKKKKRDNKWTIKGK